MPRVSIGNDVIIGAGSVVTKDIPENSIYVGNPAKFLCSTIDYIKKQQLEMEKNNVFDEKFTLREKISVQMKEEMIASINNNGVAFVI